MGLLVINSNSRDWSANGRLFMAVCLFTAGAVLYFADIVLSAAGIWAPAWQEYYINRGLYLIVCSYFA